jgi:ABC-2 type transport system permease protein
VLKPFFRLTDFIGVELLELIRQPFLLLAMVLGPFLILLVFGIGHSASQPPLKTILVIPQNIEVTRDVAYWRDRLNGPLEVIAVTANQQPAISAVQQGTADLAVLVPANAAATFSKGQSIPLPVVTLQIDPVQLGYVQFAAYVLASELNKQVIAQAASRLQQSLKQTNASQAAAAAAATTGNNSLTGLGGIVSNVESIPPEVLASPFVSKVENLASVQPNYVAFYGPAALALLLQHLAITLTSLSIVRERLLGTIELYKAAPTSAFGILLGKFLSYGLVSLLVAAALLALMLRFLGVPLLGDPRMLAITVALLLFASLGAGLTISLISTSAENAVQYSMLVLLASVFFSGFFLPLNTLLPPALAISDILPVTYGIYALQDVMLRGQPPAPALLGALAVMGIMFSILNTILFSRELRRS